MSNISMSKLLKKHYFWFIGMMEVFHLRKLLKFKIRKSNNRISPFSLLPTVNLYNMQSLSLSWLSLPLFITMHSLSQLFFVFPCKNGDINECSMGGLFYSFLLLENNKFKNSVSLFEVTLLVCWPQTWELEA